jgi:uncharacterized protein with gpF-like domain
MPPPEGINYIGRGRDRVLPPVHPNAGIGVVYRTRLQRAVAAMNASLDYWLSARWGEDNRSANRIIATMKELGRRWQSNFDELAPDVAGQFGARSVQYTTNRMEQLLDDAGWSVEFKVSPAINVIMRSAVTENVGLIRSIASQHLQKVEGIVMRGVQAGNDLKTMTKALHEEFDVPKKRAAFIALDQTKKLNSVITKARQDQAGIKRAVWMHANITTPGHFRPEHLAFSRGTHADGPSGKGPVYEVAQGAYLEGKWTYPGFEINCRCSSRPVIEGFE